MIKPPFLGLALLVSFSSPSFAAGRLLVTAVNKMDLARPSQTIELSGAELAPLGKDLERIHVQDAAGREVLCQAVDSDYDDYHKPDLVIFQADFTANETKSFRVTLGTRHQYARDEFKAFGRFVRERFDDFAWENDRIAHRTYGKALETWKGEPLTSSAIDVWSKRVSYPIVNQWYMLDQYHSDQGEGCDDYSAGDSRGCGGTGLWAANRLWVSRNFVESRTLANGPIRVMFELVYEPFEVNGISVSEVKRITLDAGQNLDHFQSFYVPYRPLNQPVTLTAAVGLKKVTGEQKELNAAHGWLAIWEPMEKNMGMLGVAAIVDPRQLEKQAEDRQNNLLLLKTAPDNSISYWAGFAWDKAGQSTTASAWQKYVDEFAQGVRSPIEVSVSAH